MKLKWDLHPDIEECIELLRQFSLPTDDIGDGSFASLVAATSDEHFIGLGGLEFYDESVLLRSVVVKPLYQGKGVAKQLVIKLLDVARQNNKTQCYLLTTTAENFFSHLGFNIVDRKHVPEAVKRSKEFSDLCPDSATVMVRKI